MLKEKLNNKNLGDMIWEEIFKVDSKDFEKIEKKLGIKFPENDIKYLKVFNCGKSVNVIFNIENEKFF